MNYLFGKIRKLNALCQESVRSFGAQYDAFSVFIFIFYLANPLKWQILGPYSSNAIIYLRVIGALLWLVLLFWRNWPRRLKKYLPLFWHFSLLYQLPFRTAFSTLYAQHSPIYDSFGLLGIVALAVLVDSKEFCILTLLGSALVTAFYFAFGSLGLPLVKLSTLFYAGMMVLSITFIKLIFFRNHDQRINERSKAYKTLAGTIAHEVRSPICTVNIACENLDLMSDRHKNELIPIIKKQTRKALSVIDSILLQVGYIEKTNKPKCLSLSLKECLSEALNGLIFSEQELSHIQVRLSRDYFVLADRLLLVQVITNLVKNSLLATNYLEKVEIIIDAIKMDNLVKISVFDNGIGISPKLQKRLFYPFLSQSENGAGIGLAFCNLAIKNMNGSIQCESEKGKFTRFTIELLANEEEQVKPEPLMPALTKTAHKLA